MRKPAAIIEIRGSNTVRYFRRTLRRMGATWSAKSHSAVEEGGPAAASPSPRRQRPPPCSAVDTVEFDAPLEAEITDIWIVAGQSNAVGENAPDKQAIPDRAKAWPSKILAFGPDGRWVDAVPSIHFGVHGYEHRDSVGPDMCFARTLIDIGLSTRVGLIPTASGGTNLYKDWQPGGTLYQYLVKQAHYGMAALPGARLRGMLWVQGESDAQQEAGLDNALAYGRHFTDFLATLRRDLSDLHPQLPVVHVIMCDRGRGDYFPYIAEVRKQQLALDLPGVIAVDMDGFEFFPEFGDGLVHLTKAGATGLGAAMALTYYTSVCRPSTMQSPRK